MLGFVKIAKRTESDIAFFQAQKKWFGRQPSCVRSSGLDERTACWQLLGQQPLGRVDQHVCVFLNLATHSRLESALCLKTWKLDGR